MSRPDEDTAPKRPGSSWHAWVEPSAEGERAGEVAPPGRRGPALGPPAVLPAIVGAIDRLEAAIERLSAIVEASASDAHRASVASANSLADPLDAVTALSSSQLAHLDQHGADLAGRLDRLHAAVVAPLAEHAAAHAAQSEANVAALEGLAARVSTVDAGFAGPLGELGTDLTT